MKWRVYLSSVLVVFLSLCFGSFIINQRNEVHAVSDISVTYTAGTSTSQWSDLFPTCSGDCLNQYSYLIVNGAPSNTSSNGWFIRLFIRYNGSNGWSRDISGDSEFAIYKLPFNGSANNYLSWGQSYTFDNDVTFTLTESYQSCPPAPSGSITLTENGTFDVTNYAEAVVDVPPEVVQGDYHDDLVSLKQAIVIVPAVALVIYFLYAIYKMLLGGKTL